MTQGGAGTPRRGLARAGSDPSLRASHDDRERVVDALRAHCADGRLTTDELQDRLAVALNATTIGELRALTADLPAVRTGALTREERVAAALCHALAFSVLIGVPFGNVVGPLVPWLVRRRHSDFVDAHGKASLSFQVSAMIYALVLAPVLVSWAIARTTLVGPVLTGFVFVVAVMLLTVVGAVRAARGGSFRYPFAIRFFR